MKKFGSVIVILNLLLIIAVSGCSKNFENRVVFVERARENLEKADYFQSQVDSQFRKIGQGNINKKKVNIYAKKILFDSNKAQGSVQNAINNIEEAKLSTDDYKLRNYYDMRINAYQVKNYMAKKSSAYAKDIKKSSKDKQKTKKIITDYRKTRAAQTENFIRLMKKADDYMELKRV